MNKKEFLNFVAWLKDNKPDQYDYVIDKVRQQKGLTSGLSGLGMFDFGSIISSVSNISKSYNEYKSNKDAIAAQKRADDLAKQQAMLNYQSGMMTSDTFQKLILPVSVIAGMYIYFKGKKR